MYHGAMVYCRQETEYQVYENLDVSAQLTLSQADKGGIRTFRTAS